MRTAGSPERVDLTQTPAVPAPPTRGEGGPAGRHRTRSSAVPPGRAAALVVPLWGGRVSGLWLECEGAVVWRGRGAAEVRGQRLVCRKTEDRGVCHLGDVSLGGGRFPQETRG